MWPWKKTVFLTENTTVLLDKKGNKIIENYQRYIQGFSNTETWISIFYIFIGIGLILAIDYYGRKKK